MQYLSPDPFGLAGGARPQGYVADPLELAGCVNASGRQLESSLYSVAYEARLTGNGTHYSGRSDKFHFQESNQQLHQAMRSDPAFAQGMEQMYPGITQGVSQGPCGAYPRRSPHPDLTWHHNANDEAAMQLVPISQH